MKNEHNEFMQHELRLPELTVRGYFMIEERAGAHIVRLPSSLLKSE